MAVSRDFYNEAWSEIEETDHVYLFTWNPKPRFYQYDKYGDNDYNNQWLTMCKKIVKLERCSKNYAIVAEISDSGKLHCHGFFVMKDKVKWIKSVLPSFKRGGFVKHAKANSHKWEVFKYHVKEIEITDSLIRDIPIVVTPFTQKEVIKCIRKVEVDVAIEKTGKVVNKSIVNMFSKFYDIDD